MASFNRNKYLFAALLLVIVFSSCQPSKKIHQNRLYLQNMESIQNSDVVVPEQKIQKADKLSILFYSDNPDASNLYNLSGNSGASGMSSGLDLGSAAAGGAAGGTAGASYLVDDAGNILMPRLGPVHVEGLTKAALKILLIEKIDTLLKHPYAEVRFLNKRVTLLGEIAKPGVINMPEERLNILDAVALSGDLTAFARYDNIMVVREENGKRTIGRLNIKDPGIYKSPFFYLEQGDFVYIEPVRKKPTGTDATLLRNVSITATIVSTIAIIYSVLKR